MKNNMKFFVFAIWAVLIVGVLMAAEILLWGTTKGLDFDRIPILQIGASVGGLALIGLIWIIRELEDHWSTPEQRADMKRVRDQRIAEAVKRSDPPLLPPINDDISYPE